MNQKERGRYIFRRKIPLSQLNERICMRTTNSNSSFQNFVVGKAIHSQAGLQIIVTSIQFSRQLANMLGGLILPKLACAYGSQFDISHAGLQIRLTVLTPGCEHGKVVHNLPCRLVKNLFLRSFTKQSISTSLI